MVDELQEKLNEIEETVLATSSESLIRGSFRCVRRESSASDHPPATRGRERLAHGENKMIRPVLLPYFRDLRDNLIRIDEQAASYADQL